MPGVRRSADEPSPGAGGAAPSRRRSAWIRRLGTALAGAAIAYPLAALAGYLLVLQISTNNHDRQLEAAMTGAFATGPAGALVAFVAGFLRTPPPRH